MPYFTINFAGLIAVVTFFGMSNRLPYYQTIATYYNGIGDLHAIDNQEFLAKEYYQRGSLYESRNHRSNYAIASMSRQEGDRANAIFYLKKSLEKAPTPYAFVNLADLYSQRESFFDAFFILEEGLNTFPDNGQLNNNLGLVYGQTEILDSALYFLNRASEDAATNKAAITNTLALLGGNNITLDLDSLSQAYATKSYLPINNNLLVLSNLSRQEWKFLPKIPGDSVLTAEQFAIWYNYAFQQGMVLDSAYLNALAAMSRLPKNQSYADFLVMAEAFGRYRNNQVGTAFSLLEELGSNSRSGAGYYFDLLGLWSLQQRAPRLALEYFQAAADAGSINAPWHLAVTLAEIGRNDLALGQLNRVVKLGNPQHQEAAKLLSSVLAIDSLDQTTEIDPKITEALLHYRWKDLSDDLQNDLMAEQPIARKKGLLKERFLAAVEAGDSIAANRVLAQLLPLLGERDELDQSFALTMKISDFRYGGWTDELDSWQPYSAATADWKEYLKAKQLGREGQLEAATEKIQALAYKNPFEEAFAMAALQLLSKQPDKEIEAYEVLLNAVQTNRYSIPLLKAYSLQCLRMNLDTYALDARDRLEPLLTPEALIAFNHQYQDLVAEMAELEKEWNP